MTINKAYINFCNIFDFFYVPSISTFYNMFKYSGFRYNTIHYIRKCRKDLPISFISQFKNILAGMLFMSSKYHVIFVDESTICPSNFQKKAWRLFGSKQYISTRIRYEHLLLLGSISSDGLEGLILTDSGMSSQLFAGFLFSIIERIWNRYGNTKQIVILMDNASCHRGLFLENSMIYAGISLIFSISGHPEFNAAEYLWEFLKQDLRRMTQYEK